MLVNSSEFLKIISVDAFSEKKLVAFLQMVADLPSVFEIEIAC